MAVHQRRWRASARASPQQQAYFDTFGFLRLPGFFEHDFDRPDRGVRGRIRRRGARPTETTEQLHLDQQARRSSPDFIDKSHKLRPLLDDPRVIGVVTGLIDENYEYGESDGNLFYCESSWHPDTYGAPLTRYHIKLSFYLDPLHGESGAIRMIPGTNHYQTPFARKIRRNLEDPQQIKQIYGVEPNRDPVVDAHERARRSDRVELPHDSRELQRRRAPPALLDQLP